MANLSNINNKFLVTTGGNVLIGQTSAVGSSIFQVTGNSTFSGTITSGGTIYSTLDSTFSTDGSISRNATVGLVIRGITGSVFDLALYGAGGTALMTNSTGTNNIVFNSGNVTVAGNVGIGVTADASVRTFIKGSDDGTNNYQILTRNSSGTNILAVRNDGNVGIGTTPITSPNSADTSLSIFSGQDCSIILKDAVETWEIYQNDNLRFSFGTTPTTVMTMQRTTGNVGIGTDSPTAKLDIKSSLTAIGTEQLLTIGHDINWNLKLQENWNASGIQFDILQKYGTGAAANVLTFFNGKVGIGETSPGYKLEVNGNMRSSTVTVYDGMGGTETGIGASGAGGNLRLYAGGTNRVTVATNAVTLGVYAQDTIGSNYIQFYNSAGTNQGYMGFGASATNDMIISQESANVNIRFLNGGAERLTITSGGDIQIPTDSASLQLRSSGSGSYTSIRRDAANQLIVANTAGNQVFGIGNGGELSIANAASYSNTLTYGTGWNATYQTLIPTGTLQGNSVYIITIKCNSFGVVPYYASAVFHIATSPNSNSVGRGNANIAPTATHVNSAAYWNYSISTAVNSSNGVDAFLQFGPTPANTVLFVKATKIMDI